MNDELRSIPLRMAMRSSPQGRTLWGTVVPYDSPTQITEGFRSFTERFVRGAFASFVRDPNAVQKVKLLAHHDDRQMPLGRAVRMEERAEGLHAEFLVSETAAGDEALTLIADGALDSFSIRFGVAKGGDTWTKNRTERTVRSGARLAEVSLVNFPAYEGALVGGVRSSGDRHMSKLSRPFQRDPFDGFDPIDAAFRLRDESDAELRSRALDAIENAPMGEVPLSTYAGVATPDDLRENATRLLERSKGWEGRRIAEHVLTTGHPAYVDEFMGYVRGGSVDGSVGRFPALHSVQQRAVKEGTTSAGGALVPFFLNPAIILTNTGTENPYRNIARVVTLTEGSTWHGVASGGVTAEITSEGTEAADAAPADLVQPAIPVYKFDDFIPTSLELVEDTEIAAQLAMLIADARDRQESVKFTTGNGTTEPQGFLTAIQAVTASRVSATTNGSFSALDVFAVANALPPRFRKNATWVADYSTFNGCRQFTVSGQSQNESFMTGVQDDGNVYLVGKPIAPSSGMEALPSDGSFTNGVYARAATASNDDILVLGDFRQYVIVDRLEMSIVSYPALSSNSRPTGVVNQYLYWRTGAGDTSSGTFGRLLRV